MLRNSAVETSVLANYMPNFDSNQNRQNMYNLMFSRFRMNIVSMEKQQVLKILIVCLYSCFIHAAWRDHTPSSVACLTIQYFPRDFINGTIFEKKKKKKIEPKMCVLILSKNVVWNISHYKNNLARCCHKRT
jgi:hypothetical protein